MKKLAAQISNDLRTFDESYIYNSELSRVWPKHMPPQDREKRIREFAKAHGLQVDVYQIGMCAIFKKPARKAARGPRTPRATKTQRKRDQR